MLAKYAMICYTYCLMDSHYQLFIKTNKANLSQGIHYLNSAYANWFRNKHQIISPLFQGRFKYILVDADHYALVLYRSLAIYFIKQFTPLSLSEITEGQIDYKNTSSESSLLTRTVKRRIDE